MEIKGISNSMPVSGVRPSMESIPVLPSVQSQGQVMANAVNAPANAEKAMADKNATDRFAAGNNQAPSSVDSGEVQKAMESIAKSLDSLSRSNDLQFSIDDELGRVVVKVVDTETKEIIKQFPSEEAISLARSLSKHASFHQAKA